MTKSLSADRRDDWLVALLIGAVFLPWMAAFAVLGILALLLWLLPGTRRALLRDRKELLFLAPWPLLALIPPIVHRNFVGLAGGVGLLLVFTLSLWFRAVMTPVRARKALRLATFAGLLADLYALAQKLLYVFRDFPATEPYTLPSNDELRTPSVFGNPNEFAAVAVFLVLATLWLYWEGELSLPMTGVLVCGHLMGLFLSASLMGMLSLFFGGIVLLALKKRWRTLGVLLGGVAVGLLLLWLVPGLLPHAAGAGHSFAMRRQIWKLFPYLFREAPVFGRGFLSYWIFSPDYVGADLGFSVRVTTNAHSLLLDGLLNFGVVGTALFGWRLLRLVAESLRRHRRGASEAALALAVMTAAAVHGLCDVTAAWPQVTVLLLAAVTAAVSSASPREAA